MVNEASINVGGWLVNPVVCHHGSLPQRLATGFYSAVSKYIGGTFTPLVYCGTKVVNGTLHMLIAQLVSTTAPNTIKVVNVVLHETPACDGLYGDFTLHTVDTLIEEAPFGGCKLEPFAYLPGDLENDPIHKAFNQANTRTIGAQFTPLAYCGTQYVSPDCVKRMFICSGTMSAQHSDIHVYSVVLTKDESGFVFSNPTTIV